MGKIFQNRAFDLCLTGNIADIRSISAVCRRHGVLLLVDNAHGAYLKFLPESLHPVDLGADLCCDSAHKTLSVLTGGAYLHISPDAPWMLEEQAKNALALFGSTSPSYLIMQSLDAANPVLAGAYPAGLKDFCRLASALRVRLESCGYVLGGDEPLKLTFRTKRFGYTGTELNALLRDKGLECEFADPDFLVMMLSPENGEEGLLRIEEALLSIEKRGEIYDRPPVFCGAQKAMSIRDAALSPCETMEVKRAEGRILAAASVGCPPAVPILVCGEKIDAHAMECFAYYGIEYCSVVAE